MLQPQLEQVGSNPDSTILLNRLTTSSTMSTECESVVPQPLGPQSLHHPTTRNDKHAHSSISYEGRLSLISPYINYPSSLRSSLALEQHSSSPALTSPFLSSSVPFGSSHSSFAYEDESRRNMFMLRSNKDFFEGLTLNYDHPLNDPSLRIKEERGEELEEGSEQTRKTAGHLYDHLINFSRNENLLETTPEPKRALPTQNESPESEIPAKDAIQVLRPPIDEGSYQNEDNVSEPSSPYRFRGNGEQDTCGLDSDAEDNRDNYEALQLMEQSYEETTEPVDHGENSKSLKCQFCSYSTDSQYHFTSHLNTHFDHKCTKCEFTTHTIGQLKEHSQEEHGSTAEELEDLESVRIPRVSTQGKVKTFKCKQCGYVTVTKGDFWKHARTHIKSEKLLTCTKCPFVTEYKHHLEYHLRNHFGSKPYKCSKCSYSCVNKSMLNSHMKSHSNVYQYRCSDCTYATKYCHSLKLHLRKYGHTPAMVLNPDGTPNPVPIIDIYGTRRGPKLKKDENGMPILPPQYQLQAHIIKAQMEATGTIPPAPVAPPEKSSKSGGRGPLNFPFPPTSLGNPFAMHSNFPTYPSFIPQEFRSINDSVSKPTECRDQLKDLEKEKEENLNVSKSPEAQEEALKCEICNFSTPSKDVLAHHQLLHTTREKLEAQPPSATTVATEREKVRKPAPTHSSEVKVLPAQNLNNMNSVPHAELLHRSMVTQNFQDYFARAMNPLFYQGIPHPALELHQHLQLLAYQKHQENGGVQVKEKSPPSPSSGKIQGSTPSQMEVVLDLSKEQTPPSNVVSSASQPPSSSTNSPSNSEASTPTAKNRRKGRAFKLERIALRLSGSGEDGENSSPEAEEVPKKELETSKVKVPPLIPLRPLQQESKEAKWKEAHHCQYCDIAFKDTILYTMHMGFHGFKDAFTCNSCGFKAKDKINFSLHIARSAHN